MNELRGSWDGNSTADQRYEQMNAVMSIQVRHRVESSLFETFGTSELRRRPSK